ncbi:hypothetical protein TNCV_3691041 [Trichonephila clavipes]|nr:hypothetical protein TNCV_3691041 [Trichonephila clavipes]
MSKPVHGKEQNVNMKRRRLRMKKRVGRNKTARKRSKGRTRGKKDREREQGTNQNDKRKHSNLKRTERKRKREVASGEWTRSGRGDLVSPTGGPLGKRDLATQMRPVAGGTLAPGLAGIGSTDVPRTGPHLELHYESFHLFPSLLLVEASLLFYA